MKYLIYGILVGVLLFVSSFSLGFNPNDISSEKNMRKTASLSKNGSLKKRKFHTSRSLTGKISMRKKTPISVSNNKSKRRKEKSEAFSLGALQKNHPLYKLGLRSQDVIKGVNGKKVSSEKSFLSLLKRSKLGEKNTLSIERGGKERNIYYTMKNGPSSKGSRYGLSGAQNLRRFKPSKKFFARTGEKRKKYTSRKQKASLHRNAPKKVKWALSDKVIGKKGIDGKKTSSKKKIASRRLASKDKIMSLSDSFPEREGVDKKKISSRRKIISRGLASNNKVVSLSKPSPRKVRVNNRKVSRKRKTVSRSLASKNKAVLSHSSSEKKKTLISKPLKKQKPLLQKMNEKKAVSLPSESSTVEKTATLLPEPSGKKKALPSFGKLSKKEKKLLARKSKYLQRAYVLQVNSQIYDQPHFDAQSIYIVPAGGRILISRKIFIPPTKFGTFYKIFIHKDRKVVGYISEIDVVPQFERGGNEINPRYAILRTQLSGRQGPVEKIQKGKDRWSVLPESPDPKVKRKHGNRFAGLSLLVKWDKERNIKGFLGGVKLSGRGFLSSSLNMDMNIMSDVELRRFHIDLLGIFDLIRGRGASLYFGGGLEVNIERISQAVVPGLAGSLGLRTLLLTGIFWQNELRVSYEFDISNQTADYNYGFLTSFQFRF